VFTRRKHCDVLAVKPDMTLAYLIECKDYQLSRKQQSLAVRELNRNYTYALELLNQSRLHPQKILRVLVAQAFNHRSRGILQYAPKEFPPTHQPLKSYFDDVEFFYVFPLLFFLSVVRYFSIMDGGVVFKGVKGG
jgi:hypothetical protein